MPLPWHCWAWTSCRAWQAVVQDVPGAGSGQQEKWPWWPQAASMVTLLDILTSSGPSGSVCLLCTVTSTGGFALTCTGRTPFLTPLSSTPTSRAAEKTSPGKGRTAWLSQSWLWQIPTQFLRGGSLLSCYKQGNPAPPVTWEWIIFWGVIITISQGPFVNTGNSMARSGIS